MIVVDRIEGETAVLEIHGATVDIPVSALPEGAREGSVLGLTLDPDRQSAVEEQNRARLERLKKRNPAKGGLLTL